MGPPQGAWGQRAFGRRAPSCFGPLGSSVFLGCTALRPACDRAAAHLSGSRPAFSIERRR
eukprot:1790384-Prymnesium_polylepis.1